MLGLFFFGGETLREFALALIVGTLSGTYSSVFIASPLLTHWKEREGVWRRRRQAIEAELGEVPAYATALGGAPVDVAPREERRRGARRLTAPDDPQRQVSREEFDEMVRDLEVDDRPPAAPAPARPSRRQATAVEEPERGAVRMPEPDEAADARPEDVVMPDDERRERERRGRRGSNRRHGRPR
jgi:SecD/SecF fusion protein